MIEKGYHYKVDCDVADCNLAYVVGTTRHNFDARRKAKQELIKKGWVAGGSGTLKCPKCVKKHEVETLKAAREDLLGEVNTFRPVEVEAEIQPMPDAKPAADTPAEAVA